MRALILVVGLLVAGSALAQDSWQLRLSSVQVEQQREDSGDRPYFNTITFSARLHQLRPRPQVRLVEQEPHDWVSKREYQGRTRLRRGDHMSDGESLPIPDWMGLHQWEGLEVRPESDPIGAPIFGALVVSLDNNNTPPHVVRDLLRQVEVRLRDTLQAYVSEGRILEGIPLRDLQANPRAHIPTLRARITDLAFSLTRNLGFNLFDWTFGSTFNPDKLTGIHAFVFVGIEGIEQTTVSSDDPDRSPIRIQGDQIHWSAVYGTPDSFLQTAVFRGSGARYRVPVRFRAIGEPPPLRLNRLVVRIQTGDDDLREGSRARATALDGSGRELGSVDLNRGRRWADRTEQTVTLPLRRAVALGDVARIRLDFESGGGFSGDNWNVDAVTVYTSTAAPPLKVVRGRPLVRFTGDTRTFHVDLR